MNDIFSRHSWNDISKQVWIDDHQMKNTKKNGTKNETHTTKNKKKMITFEKLTSDARMKEVMLEHLKMQMSDPVWRIKLDPLSSLKKKNTDLKISNVQQSMKPYDPIVKSNGLTPKKCAMLIKKNIKLDDGKLMLLKTLPHGANKIVASVNEGDSCLLHKLGGIRWKEQKGDVTSQRESFLNLIVHLARRLEEKHDEEWFDQIIINVQRYPHEQWNSQFYMIERFNYMMDVFVPYEKSSMIVQLYNEVYGLKKFTLKSLNAFLKRMNVHIQKCKNVDADFVEGKSHFIYPTFLKRHDSYFWNTDDYLTSMATCPLKNGKEVQGHFLQDVSFALSDENPFLHEETSHCYMIHFVTPDTDQDTVVEFHQDYETIVTEFLNKLNSVEEWLLILFSSTNENEHNERKHRLHMMHMNYIALAQKIKGGHKHCPKYYVFLKKKPFLDDKKFSFAKEDVKMPPHVQSINLFSGPRNPHDKKYFKYAMKLLTNKDYYKLFSSSTRLKENEHKRRHRLIAYEPPPIVQKLWVDDQNEIGNGLSDSLVFLIKKNYIEPLQWTVKVQNGELKILEEQNVDVTKTHVLLDSLIKFFYENIFTFKEHTLAIDKYDRIKFDFENSFQLQLFLKWITKQKRIQMSSNEIVLCRTGLSFFTSKCEVSLNVLVNDPINVLKKHGVTFKLF
jgi:hypothetical protein